MNVEELIRNELNKYDNFRQLNSVRFFIYCKLYNPKSIWSRYKISSEILDNIYIDIVIEKLKQKIFTELNKRDYVKVRINHFIGGSFTEECLYKYFTELGFRVYYFYRGIIVSKIPLDKESIL